MSLMRVFSKRDFVMKMYPKIYLPEEEYYR